MLFQEWHVGQFSAADTLISAEKTHQEKSED